MGGAQSQFVDGGFRLTNTGRSGAPKRQHPASQKASARKPNIAKAVSSTSINIPTERCALRSNNLLCSTRHQLSRHKPVKPICESVSI